MTHKYISISDAFSSSWELWKKNCFIFALMFFAAVIITGLINNIAQIPLNLTNQIQDLSQIINGTYHSHSNIDKTDYRNLGISISLSYLVSFITYPIYIGISNCILNVSKKIEDEASFKGFKMPISTYLKFYVIYFLVESATFFGILLFIIPGLYISARLYFASTYLLDNPESDIMSCLKASWNMTKGNIWKSFLLIVLNPIIIFAGFLCCCLGVYFAIPLTAFIKNEAYFQIKDNIQPD